MAEGFSLNDLYHLASRYWWTLFACILIGGLTGIVIAATRQPLYEASASLLVTVDRGRSIVTDDVTVVQATDRVRALILSDDTLEKALDLLSVSTDEMGEFDSIASFRSALRITNRPASFELLVYANEPTLAAEVANAWAEASLAALDEAYLHAIRAAEFQNTLYEASCTLTLRIDGTQGQAAWLCTSGRWEDEGEDLPEAILEEVKATRGILPIFSFTLGQEAQSPQSPILWARSSFIISGLIVGGLLGIFVLMIINTKNRHQ
jgi:uncharacterized protein involved in exopolysaccharide biosynthesis